MSPYTRAILIGCLGPGLQVFGLIWALARAYLATDVQLTFRYLLFSPPHLVIAVGVLVTLISLPLAIEVAQSDPEELEMEVFEPDPVEEMDEEVSQERPVIPVHWKPAE